MADDASVPFGWVECYEAGLASYRAQNFSVAIQDFEKARNLRKQDPASSMMIERCKQQLDAPAGEALRADFAAASIPVGEVRIVAITTPAKTVTKRGC